MPTFIVTRGGATAADITALMAWPASASRRSSASRSSRRSGSWEKDERPPRRSHAGGAARGGLADLRATVAMADQRSTAAGGARRVARCPPTRTRGSARACSCRAGRRARHRRPMAPGGIALCCRTHRWSRGKACSRPTKVIAASGLASGRASSASSRRAVAGIEALPRVRRAELVRAFPNRVTCWWKRGTLRARPFRGLQWRAPLLGGRGGRRFAPRRGVTLDTPLVSGVGADECGGGADAVRHVAAEWP